MDEPVAGQWAVGVTHDGRSLHLPFDPACAVDLLIAQRTRFVDRLSSLGPSEWDRPTRCHLWSAADVVLHVAQTNGWILQAWDAVENPAVPSPFQGFDNRVSPHEQVVEARGRHPEDLCTDLLKGTEQVAERNRSARPEGPLLHMTLGRYHAHLLCLHLLWDSWLHERDIFGDDPTHAGRDELGTVGTYSVFTVAAVLAAMQQTAACDVDLAGPGGLGLRLHLAVADEVGVSARTEPEPPDPDSRVRGDIPRVVDALAGRGILAKALSGPDEVLELLGRVPARLRPSA